MQQNALIRTQPKFFGITTCHLEHSDQAIMLFMKTCGKLVYHTNDKHAYLLRLNLEEDERLGLNEAD